MSSTNQPFVKAVKAEQSSRQERRGLEPGADPSRSDQGLACPFDELGKRRAQDHGATLMVLASLKKDAMSFDRVVTLTFDRAS